MRTILVCVLVAFLLASCGSDPSIGTQHLIVVVQIEGRGKVTGAGAYGIGESCTLTAIPDSVRGYQFRYWLEMPDSLFLNKDSVYTFTVDESRYLKAIFSRE